MPRLHYAYYKHQLKITCPICKNELVFVKLLQGTDMFGYRVPTSCHKPGCSPELVELLHNWDSILTFDRSLYSDKEYIPEKVYHTMQRELNMALDGDENINRFIMDCF